MKFTLHYNWPEHLTVHITLQSTAINVIAHIYEQHWMTLQQVRSWILRFWLWLQDQRLLQQKKTTVTHRNDSRESSEDHILITCAFLSTSSSLPCQHWAAITAFHSNTRLTSLSCSCSPLILSSSILCSSCASLIRSFKSWFSNSNSLEVKIQN